ncbi:hypothetical protein IV203_002015 [Nitzschia inconspicua]|uniref:Uncharacterized protein n=1 Tax=Nitzschia inconspicua TaxID=303405 RepID=A0A9K3PRV0_9STRA|nr:hypothetical protein IV203_002015 [Nitzschia inconspicua]
MIRLISKGREVSDESPQSDGVLNDTDVGIDRSKEKRRWLIGFRRTAEPHSILPLLRLHPDIAERIRQVVGSLLEVVFLSCCTLAFGYLIKLTSVDEEETVREVQKARQELGLRLARSIREYNEAVSS